MSILTPAVTENDHVQGSANARITLVEYGDYQCPSCGSAYPIIKEVQSRLGSELRFVFRNFPLASMHKHAQQAAEAAEAAGAQGKFWEMHDLLFENQGSLEETSLKRYAGKIGLNITEFNQDIEKHAHASRVKSDFSSGVRSGVNGTPTFFISGLRYDGSWDLIRLLEALRAAGKSEQSGILR